MLSVLILCIAGCHGPLNPEPAELSLPGTSAVFEEIAAEVGLEFIHDSGAEGRFFMPEHVGSGAALFDFDNDGKLDIYLIHCGGIESQSRNRLFHQELDGTFLDVSEGSGLDVTGYGMGASAADINNDGLTDLLLTEYGAARLFLNLSEGKFREITDSCGIDNPRWATAASFLDFDRDGWLDLVVANYVDYIQTQQCRDAAGALEYCGPQNFEGTVTRIFRNLGRTESVAFDDVTVQSGLAQSTGPALGLFCADFNGDRWIDILIADDGKPNRLYLNQQNNTFNEEAALRGLAYNAMGETAGNMGVGFGDVNHDGMFDLFVTHLTHEQHALWVQGPQGFFQDRTAAFSLANPAWRGTGFGAVIADFDLDSTFDLAFVNGLVQRGNDPAPRIEGLNPRFSAYAQRNQLFLGNTEHGFVDVSEMDSAFSGHAAVGRGLACGDIDNDGDLDMLATSAGGPAQLFRNVAPKRGNWILVKAVDPEAGGRDAIGAEIIVEAAGKTRWSMVQPSSSYLVSNDPRVHFGLGGVATVDSIVVRWPDGIDERFSGGEVDRVFTIRKGSGIKL